MGENDSKAQIALTNAVLAEKEAEASRRSQVAAQQADTEIQRARAIAQAQYFEAEEIVPQEIRKRKIKIDAEAEAASKVLVARGEAEALLAIKEAEAEGIQKLLNAKAQGYKQLVEACGDDAKSASTMLLIEKLEEIVRLQTEAIKNIKIDKITVWDGGNGGDSTKGSSTSNFISQFGKSLPPLHDIASMAGLELPPYLGKMSQGVEQ
jgi:flotillin